MHNIARKLRQRRDAMAFERAMRDASPAMRQELYAAAAHNSHLLTR